MAAPVKVPNQSLIALQALATAASAAGKVEAELNVSTAVTVEIAAAVGRTATTAFAAGTGVDWLFQTSDAATGAGGWRTICQVGTGTLIACNTNTLAATGNGAGTGDTTPWTLTANAATASYMKNPLHIYHAADVTQDEFAYGVYCVTSGTALRVDHDAVNAHNGDVVYDGNWLQTYQFDVSAANRFRVLCINNSGVTVVVKCMANLFTGWS